MGTSTNGGRDQDSHQRSNRGTIAGRLARLAGLAVLLALAGLSSAMAANVNDSELTTPERLDLFDQVGPIDKVTLLGKICQPDPKTDITKYKIPDFLCKVLQDEGENPVVRQAALEGMVALIQKEDQGLRSTFIPVLNKVLNGAKSTLVQEWVLLAAPSMVDATGPGPNKLLLDKIVNIAEDGKLETDSEVRMRCQAILALGKIAHKDHLDKFFGLLKDSKQAIVVAAIKAVKLYLNSPNAKTLELKQPQISPLIHMLKAKETPDEAREAILLVLGVNAMNFRRAHTNTQTAPGVAEGMQEIKRILTDGGLPPYYLVSACIDTLGKFAQPDSVPLISQILVLPYLKTAEAMPARRASVTVLDQVINANIGEGKVAVKVVEDAATVLTALLADTKEDMEIRKAAALYLADVRFACYHRELYFDALFKNAYTFLDANGQPTWQLDAGLSAVCRKAMEVLADRTFPDDWTGVEMKAWWDKVGKALLTKRG